MNEQQFEKLVANLQDVMRCPNCSSAYFLDDIHYLGQMEAMTFLHLRCHKCSTPVFASVAVATGDGHILSGDGIEKQVIKTRKLQSDPDKSLCRRINHDDVIDIHMALDQATDNFDRFLSR
ncbi:TPA: hypothetical protein DIV45_03120 [Patescibacteria group bacterium]|uniref:Uncharacterized protein n=2 Tax=Bacteria division Kazan-3B-28 TaxID=1798534 RepID=A0A0G1KTB0_UNCK3|nr:MAG: hypothetical protein VE96_C0004G0013 [candidate division Kazan bacterium GW2011_GWA1_44_22]KKT86861.1 MAG: hypothetical protein VE97_C0013G0005 [candidate division Kazan bacterium GW2011_GWB1_45_10]HCR42320.1 hypothetical protein [Patescibacteria group bacterium]